MSHGGDYCSVCNGDEFLIPEIGGCKCKSNVEECYSESLKYVKCENQKLTQRIERLELALKRVKDMVPVGYKITHETIDEALEQKV